MQAMILAAGLGTRLRPITLNLPKALVPIQEQPALEWIIRRLSRVGVQSIIVNTHYFAEQVEVFVQQRTHLEPLLTISHESDILGTGGGLLQTQKFWDHEPFFLHNVDIFSTCDLLAAYAFHKESQGIATLLTQERNTQTKLLIDESHHICGIHYLKSGEYNLYREPQGKTKEHGFSGIHVISPQIFPLIKESEAFSIIDCYMRLIHEGYPIRSFDMQDSYWKDIGTAEKLLELEKDWRNSKILQECHGQGS